MIYMFSFYINLPRCQSGRLAFNELTSADFNILLDLLISSKNSGSGFHEESSCFQAQANFVDL